MEKKAGCLTKTLRFLGNASLGYIPLASTIQHTILKTHPDGREIITAVDLAAIVVPLISLVSRDLTTSLGLLALCRIAPAFANGLVALK